MKLPSCTLFLVLTAEMFAHQPLLFGQQATVLSAAVPTLVNFSGTLTDVNDKPLTAMVGVTFDLYNAQEGGSPLWIETQNVQPDKHGNYSVMLGATTSQGLPRDLFVSGEARWLGVQAQGQPEQPRVMLLSVPYAMEAADAQTLGGMPASAFMLAPTPASSSSETPPTNGAGPHGAPALSGGGTTNYVPLWVSTSQLGNSKLYQTGGNVGVGTTSPAAALDVNGAINTSTAFNVGGKAFAFGSAANANAFLGFSGNTSTTGTNNTSNGPTALVANTSGGFNTADGYAALQHNSSGSDNTANGAYALEVNSTGGYNTAMGYVALALNSTGSDNTAVGYSALYANTASYNTATGYGALYSNTSASYNTAVGYQALYSNTSGVNNVSDGAQALYENTTGYNNTANGELALEFNTTGYQNTANGQQALGFNTTGSSNSAFGSDALLNNNTGSYNTAVGWSSGVTAGNLTNATAIGAGATVSESDALVLGGTGSFAVNVGIGTSTPTHALEVDVAGATVAQMAMVSTGTDAAISLKNAGNGGHEYWIDSGSGGAGVGNGNFAVWDATSGRARFVINPSGNIGLGTISPSNLLTLVQGGGPALADGWNTYSSRRWKTNVQTLHGALDKVERLRGVSYQLQDSGRHEIGVIAEEVGQVVPEVVTYEANGKDASGVDYSRLTALLIEAVKQQQKQIDVQQRQIARLNRKLEMLETNLSTLRHGEKPSVLASDKVPIPLMHSGTQ